MTERVQFARKARQRVSRSGKVTAESESSSADESGDSAPTKRHKKRAKFKTKPQRKKGLKGKLEIFGMLPLELLGEIASHLGPLDLLALKSVNKQCHSLLTAKASQALWIAARKRANIPDFKGTIPLREWQYVELLLGKSCHGCHGTKVGKIYHDWYLRKNLCKRCRHAKIVNLTKLSNEEPALAARLHPLIARTAIATPFGRAHAIGYSYRYYHDPLNYAYTDDLWHLDAVLRDLDDQDEDSDIAAEREPAPPVQTTPPHSHEERRRSAARRSKKYVDESNEEDDDEGEVRISRRAQRWASQRIKFLKELAAAKEYLRKLPSDLSRLKESAKLRTPSIGGNASNSGWQAITARAQRQADAREAKHSRYDRQRRRDRWFGRERVTVRGRIGSLVEVLQHQHEHHNLRYERPNSKAATSDKLPKRVDLPLEVACGVASLLELHHLDDSRAKMSHLDEGSEKSSGYHWRNSKIGRIRFQAYSTNDKSAWHKLLNKILTESKKAAKLDLCLDPPDIVFVLKRDNTDAIVEMSDSEDEDEDGGESDDEGDSEGGGEFDQDGEQGQADAAQRVRGMVGNDSGD
ncbi:hypothetical protein JCM8202_000516 [Rhodotorula sphaerocarpa]